MKWEDAKVHVLSTAVQFGTSMFEGVRCYATPDGPKILLLGPHLRRLQDSCKMYRMDWSYLVSTLLCAACAVIP